MIPAHSHPTMHNHQKTNGNINMKNIKPNNAPSYTNIAAATWLGTLPMMGNSTSTTKPSLNLIALSN